MLREPRLIANLSLCEGLAVKTRKFTEPRYLGEPQNITRLFSKFEADELAVFEISNRFGKSETGRDILSGIIRSASMPISYGGGLTNLENCKEIFQLGFDKVIIKSALHNGEFIKELAKTYGTQAVVACLNIRLNDELYDVNGKILNENGLVSYISVLSQLGVGEFILHDIENEGTRLGNNLVEIADTVAKEVSAPIILQGGFDNTEEAALVLKRTKVDSVAAGSMFAFHKTRNSVFINYPSRSKWQELIDFGNK